MESETHSMVHILMVSFPGQGHVNPLLRLGKLLASKGMFISFSADDLTGREMIKASNITPQEPIPVGDGFVSFEFFSSGLSENDPCRANLEQYMNHLETVGKQAVSQMLRRHADQKRPVSCLIHNPFIPWVSDVAEEFALPSVVLWVQSCACFAAYYSYQHGLVQFPTESDPETSVRIPCIPVLRHDEVPSFLHPSTQYPFLARAVLGQFKSLSKVSCVLMETFKELEQETVDYMSKLYPIKTVGPLFKYPIVQNTAVRGDFKKASEGCIDFLDTKPASSVVYVSFGSIVYLQQEQIDEIAYGLLNAGVSFLWVLKQPDKIIGFKPLELPEGFLDKAGDKGKVVDWSPQENVLAHPSVNCFMTHCGWNSTMEALTSGVPVVAFPQWGDQVTDAFYLVDYWKVGVRMGRGEIDNKRIVTREEVENALREAAAGPKAEEMKRNMLRLKKSALAAVAAGGSSDQNVQSFVDEVKVMSIKNNPVQVEVQPESETGEAN